MRKIDIITDHYPDCSFLQADGFDDAIIGVDNNVEKLIYSRSKAIKVLIDRDGMDATEAIEFFDYNVAGAYVGEKTPIWVEDSLFEDE